MSREVFRIEDAFGGALFADEDATDHLDIGVDFPGCAQIHTSRLDRERVAKLRDALTVWLAVSATD